MKGKQVGVGVTGGIAAYKAADLVSKLAQAGAVVTVIMTRNAQEFVRPLTFEALSGQPVVTELFGPQERREPRHVALAEKLDLLVIAPATADFIGKASAGIADDALLTTLISVACPVVICPAMNSRMYTNQIVQANLSRLKAHGYVIVEPEEGWLSCGSVGVGRLASVERIVQTVARLLGSA